MTQVTREFVEEYLATRESASVAQFVGRALVVLFNNQTESEKTVNSTTQDNGVGFTGADAHSGCISAKYFLKHRTLQDWQVERWTRKNRKGISRLAKYWRQLDAAAQRKAEGNSSRLPRAPLAGESGNPAPSSEWSERVREKAEHAALERQQEAEAYRKEMRREALSRARSWSEQRLAIRSSADPRSI